MSAFLIVAFKVKETSWIEGYRANASPMVEKYGGEYLARSSEVTVLEGELPKPDTAAILRFPSLQAMHDFLNSAEYQPYREMRISGTEGIMFGFES